MSWLEENYEGKTSLQWWRESFRIAAEVSLKFCLTLAGFNQAMQETLHIAWLYRAYCAPVRFLWCHSPSLAGIVASSRRVCHRGCPGSQHAVDGPRGA